MKEQQFQNQIHRFLAGELSAEESEHFLMAVHSSAERQKFFENYLDLWQKIGEYDQAPVSDKTKQWERLETSISHEEVKPRVRTLAWSLWLRIAASVLIIGMAWFIWNRNFSVHNEPVWVHYETGEVKREIVLPDASKVWLDKNSSILFDSLFSTRVVKLEGKALFDVTHLEDHSPFIVRTRQSEITVLGTIFLVDSKKNQDSETVFVSEGRVAVKVLASGLDQTILQMGEQVRVNQTGLVEKLVRAETNLMSWQNGHFVFTDAPLSEILPLLENFYGIRFRVSNGMVLNCTFNTVLENVPLEDVLDELGFGLNLKIRGEGEGQYLIEGTACP